MSFRLDFLSWCLQQGGKPYVWGAKGPDSFDCSGIITAGYFAVGLPDWRQTKSSADLFDSLDEVEISIENEQSTPKPKPGDLAFWGDPVNHVMTVWGDGKVFGACGGNRECKTVEDAYRLGARVRFRAGVNYRPNFRGYRTSPFEDFETDLPTQGEVA